MDAPFVVPEVQTGDGEVLDKLLVLQRERVAAVLATVVEATGSTPARAGFKMIVTAESQFGTVGGGAFENVIVERCREMIVSASQPALVRHSTRDLGMCCGGTMTAFWSPICRHRTHRLWRRTPCKRCVQGGVARRIRSDGMRRS